MYMCFSLGSIRARNNLHLGEWFTSGGCKFLRGCVWLPQWFSACSWQVHVLVNGWLYMYLYICVYINWKLDRAVI